MACESDSVDDFAEVDAVSLRTFRRRQTAQLRNFGLDAEEDAGAGRVAIDVAFFSEADAEPLASTSGFPLGDK
ncbi:hypothetical protein N0V82_000971 [Gnomoniopsis sp. IMI 355080]|nr:hypothetical protein N0V82_000971 [Gnomoniopsis sp. IMI 355080]